MKIAVFYPSGNTAWSITKGVCSTFSKMGHEVTDCGEDYNESLIPYHFIFVSGPEYLWRKLRETYPLWDSLSATKVGWLHETIEREDYGHNKIAVDGKLPIQEIFRLVPHLYTPAIQDRGHVTGFLPFGVDTEMFHPRGKLDFCQIYTGSLYSKRRSTLERYPEIKTLAAYREYATVEEYAVAIGNASVVLNLPSLSEASNTRTFEVLASRTALITPSMLHADGIFEHKKHLLYYQGSPATAFEEVREMASKIAENGYEEILKKHTIKHRLEEVFRQTNRPIRFSSRRKM